MSTTEPLDLQLPEPSQRARDVALARLREADPQGVRAPHVAGWIIDTLAREIDKHLPPIHKVAFSRDVTQSQLVTLEIEAADYSAALAIAEGMTTSLNSHCPDGVEPWGDPVHTSWAVASYDVDGLL